MEGTKWNRELPDEFTAALYSHWHEYTIPLSDNKYSHNQSHKNPVSASAMTGKFLQIRKVFVASSLLAEEFLDTLQYKISR